MGERASSEVVALRRRLLDWYQKQRRDLPWRADRDLYRVVVSEFMLQQTRVETVLRHYEKFLHAFPDFASLAAADIDAVLAAWSGLGYYRRARNLHRLAKAIAVVSPVPRTPAAWRALPGVGAYTAAAVTSIVFGEPVACVDGNVERVIARLLALPGSPKRVPGRRRVEALAGRIVDLEDPGTSNQAMMELGATICRPRAPACDQCPVTVWCTAHAAGDVESYPRDRVSAPARSERHTAVVVRRRHRYLLFRVAADASQFAGLWLFPWVHGALEDGGGEADGPAVSRRLAAAYRGHWRLTTAVGTIRHTVTDRRLRVDVVRGERRAERGAVAEGPEAGWFSRREIGAIPTGSLVDKILRLDAGA